MERILDNNLAYERIDTWIESMYRKFPATFESPVSYSLWKACEVVTAVELLSEAMDTGSFLADVQNSLASVSKYRTEATVYGFALLEYHDITVEDINKCMSTISAKWGSEFKIRHAYSPDSSFSVRLTLISYRYENPLR